LIDYSIGVIGVVKGLAAEPPVMMTEVGIAACPRPMVVEGNGLHHRRLPILRIPIFVRSGSATRRHHEERKKRGYNSCPKLHGEPPYLNTEEEITGYRC
jgi:hypothetical protein